MANVMPRMEKCFMAADNKTKSREQRIKSRIGNVEESDKESTEGNKPKTGVEDPKWRRHWSLVFRKMK